MSIAVRLYQITTCTTSTRFSQCRPKRRHDDKSELTVADCMRRYDTTPPAKSSNSRIPTSCCSSRLIGFISANESNVRCRFFTGLEPPERFAAWGIITSRVETPCSFATGCDRLRRPRMRHPFTHSKMLSARIPEGMEAKDAPRLPITSNHSNAPSPPCCTVPD